ncbi:MAG: glycosyltransferase [Bacteroidetes bacterium]|nr:glycosyltransferase [Bacteroidota bacterium]
MASKIKICHLSSVHLALDTRLFYRFCQSLSQHYDVTLIAVHPKKEIRNNIAIIPFRRFKNKILRVLVTWFLMLVKALKVNARLYHIHDPELIPCGLFLKIFGKKVIFDIHENIAEDIFDKPWIQNKKLLHSFFLFFERLAIKNFWIFLAENSYEPRYKAMGANYEIVLNYPDLKFFHAYENVNRNPVPRIFYIGILLRSRGIIEIAEAIYILKLRGTEVHFDIVGELYTGLDAELDALPFISEIKKQLHFHGRLPLEQGYEISRNAAIGMCIIHPMKNSIGSYPTKMFEFMAIGLPQIVSNFPLYESVAVGHHCGISADPKNPEDIANAIENLLQNPTTMRLMSENGLKEIGQYSWDSQFQKALLVYQKLLM